MRCTVKNRFIFNNFRLRPRLVQTSSHHLVKLWKQLFASTQTHHNQPAAEYTETIYCVSLTEPSRNSKYERYYDICLMFTLLCRLKLTSATYVWCISSTLCFVHCCYRCYSYNKWIKTIILFYYLGVKPIIHQSELVVPFKENSSFRFVVLWQILHGME